MSRSADDYCGQRQRWFALQFLGEDKDIRLDLDPHPEFDAWRWAELAELPDFGSGLQASDLRIAGESFARFASPRG